MTRNGELGIVVRAVRSLKGRIAAGEDKASTAEAQDCKTLNKMSELQVLVEGLS